MLSPIVALISLLPRPGAPARPASVPGLTDANIIAIFDAANTYDIETGMLGEQKGSTKEVRAVGVSLVRDHRRRRRFRRTSTCARRHERRSRRCSCPDA